MDTLPLALGIMHSRPYYRCRHCNLVQFLQRSQLCRRCGRTLRMFEEPLDDTPLDEEASIANLSTRLQILLRGSGWTQQIFAERAGIARATFSRVLSGVYGIVPSLAGLEKLASAFGVPLSYLFRPVNGNFYREIHSEIFRALQPEQLKYVAQACALLAKNKREGRDAIELFLGRRGKPSGPRPRKRRSSS